MAAKSQKKSPPREVAVVAKRTLTPHMLRVTLGGDSLADFPHPSESAYIKLRLTEPPADSEEKPVIRTYTVRHFDPERRQLDVDFVLHHDQGPAAQWAQECRPGDTIRIMGPGPRKLVDASADWFLLVGDMSALPAIAANVDALPATARGYVLLEIIDPNDRQELTVPGGVTTRWIVNPHPDQPDGALLAAVRSLEWLDGRPSVWVAGEFETSMAIRNHLREDRGLDRRQLYASSYWQIGQTEDGHRITKANAG